MSLIRNALVTLTTLGPVYGLQLREELKARTGRDLNSGQVYLTLERAVRDHYVEVCGTTHDGLSLWRATATGNDLVSSWLSTPEPDFAGLVLQVRLALSLPGDAHRARAATLLNKALTGREAILAETAQTQVTAATVAQRQAASATEEQPQQPDAHSRAKQLSAGLGHAATSAEQRAVLTWLRQAAAAATAADTSWPLRSVRPKKGRAAHRDATPNG